MRERETEKKEEERSVPERGEYTEREEVFALSMTCKKCHAREEA